MALRDRFFTPTTARAIMSWRILLGVGAGLLSALLGLPVAAAVGVGAVLYAASVVRAMPKPEAPAVIDPFVLSEPWRQLMQAAQGSRRRLHDTVAGVDPGPLRTQLDAIADQLQHAIDDAWRVAKRGDEIDDAVRQLDPIRLRSQLGTIERRLAERPSDDATAAAASVRSQLASADRLRLQSQQAADSLRLTQTQLDELVARAAEVKVGASDSGEYARQVDELVVKLEALRQAVEETRTA